MNKSENAVIIVAAGASTRFGSSTPKQFLKLGSMPVFMWSVRAFQKTQCFSQIIVVVSSPYLRTLQPLAQNHGFELTCGGDLRSDSVKAGLMQLKAPIKYVAIHDGARPLITPDIIIKGLDAARRHSASVIAVPARDTIKLSTQKFVVKKTIPRSSIWLAQTPQTFKRSVIERAYTRRRTMVTDDAQAVESSGIAARIVPGDYRNLKITDRRDLEIARLLMKA
ncbi:MAG: 2-C-methyl-D-erythritol 4-phosphate cytidylyltransferase [Endomicrobiales bacterium]|jgi:2-C-methyl-D-erythritol 4-phosphate cytidylyltransferase